MAQDLKLTYKEANSRFGLALTSNGDIILRGGQPSTVQQIFKALMTVGNVSTFQKDREIGLDSASTVRAALEEMREQMVENVGDGFPNVLGWNLYRSVGDEWESVNGTQLIQHTYTDTGLDNGTVYYYGIKRVASVNGVTMEEADFVNVEAIMPSSAERYQLWSQASHMLAYPSSEQVQFWLKTNTPFYGDELVEEVLEVSEIRAADPRQKKYYVRLKNYNGDDIPINPTEL